MGADGPAGVDGAESGVDGPVRGLGACEQPTAAARIPAVVSAITDVRFMVTLSR
jgi:hypothetical protein